MSFSLLKDNSDSIVKYAVDATSALVVAAALTKFLPAVAALFSIVWTTIRIFETRTVRDYLERRRARRKKTPSPE